ncbi:MAG: EamA family transporter [Acidobacteriota bacterium]
MFWIAFALIVVANVVYHLAQKSTSATVHPVATMIVAYGVSLLLCLVLLPWWPSDAPVAPWRSFSWSAVALGIAIVGVELGFLLAYRAGWQISLASVTVSVTLALILSPIGVLAFHESWSPQKSLGLALCMAGLFLLGR